MINVEEALCAVQNEAEKLFFSRSGALCSKQAQEPAGVQIILEDVKADRPFPPFDRVLMDGVALRFDDFDAEFLRTGKVRQDSLRLEIEAVQAAGEKPQLLSMPRRCIEVMTGAALPQRADTVIKYEDLERGQDFFVLREGVQVTKGQNIQRCGSESCTGDLLISSGTELLSPHWAVLASVGIGKPLMLASPKIAVIGTGNELVPVEAEPNDWQIRSSNPLALRAALFRSGFSDVSTELVKDDPVELELLLKRLLSECEVCILTGAVSAGKYDFVPETLRNLGVVEIFHMVSQRPGKPMWFGKTASGRLVFALPGNPVSALVSCYVYVIEALRIINGCKKNSQIRYARLSQKIEFLKSENMTFFVPVAIEHGTCGTTFAKPIPHLLSSHLVPVLASDGFVECHAGKKCFERGESLPVRIW